MKVACRWPGGMTLMIPGKLGGPHRTFRLAGPPGVPSVLPVAMTKGAPSRNSATHIQRSVLDTVKRLSETAHGEYHVREYGITEIPGDFWHEWAAIHEKHDVITKRMVYAL